MKIDRLFSAADRERIRAAVDAAERDTSGEIVPYVVERSDPFEEAEWRCGAAVAALALAVLAVLHNLPWVWLPVNVAMAVTGAAAGFFAGMLIVRLTPPVLRLCAGRRLLDLRVGQRAAEAFLTEEVFVTRERTGILVFVSLLEHRVLVMGDAGINARVATGEWTEIVATVTRGIKRNAPADGLIEAIRACGELLKRSGVTVRPDDRNELRDELRMAPSRRRKKTRK